jgi:AraC family transcriptional regulator
MGPVRSILRAVDCMERNLTAPVSIADIASEATYSPFHFLRLFKALTGETPGSYLRRRRLAEAAGELVRGRKRIIEIAVEYQFGSQEAFTRAFRSCFGVTPLAFRRKGAGHWMEAARRIDETFLVHCMEVVTMEPRIEKRGAVKLVGLVYYGDNRNWEVVKLWEEFMPLMGKVPNSLGGREAYGLCFYSESFSRSGLFSYMAAIPVSSLDVIPMEMVGKTLPGSEYAVFRHKGRLVGESNTIKDTYAYAYGTWLPNSGYENPPGYDFELYGERFRGNQDPESELEVWIPIRKK